MNEQNEINSKVVERILFRENFYWIKENEIPERKFLSSQI